MTNDSIKTLCPYCGVGCGLEVSPPAQAGKPTNRDSEGKPVWKVRGDRDHPSSQGMVCVKGATIIESIDRDRLLYPMLRDTLDEPFRRVSWDEALQCITERMRTVLAANGPDALCVYGSGQFVTEDYYTAQKLMKGCLGTNNFDANSRLCMSSAVSGYQQSFGSDGPPCCYDDLDLTDCAVIVGSNAAECHPIVFNRLRKHHKASQTVLNQLRPDQKSVKLIVVDPRRTPTAEVADLHLAIQPGTDIDLFNGIAYLLLQWGEIDSGFIEECTRDFQAFVEVVQHYPPAVVQQRCGISYEELETAARYWAESKRVLSLWSMGLNQSSEGTAKVCSLINLHLMTGQLGRPGSGPFSLTGQPNAMGGREAGGLSHLLPGYRSVKEPQHRADVEAFWGLPSGQISPYPGRSTWEMITGLETGEVQFLWIAATNPAVSMPDLERTKAALRRSPFTVYQEAYYPTETAAYAHVLLPATQWSEKTGVMTNSERRVSLCSAFQRPPGEARDDWEIFAEVGRRLGFRDQFPFQTAADVFAEFAQLTQGRLCDVSGLSHERLRRDGPQQWPCPEGIKNEKLKMKNDGAGELRFPSGDKGARGSRGAGEQENPKSEALLKLGGDRWSFSHREDLRASRPKIQNPKSKRLYTDLRFPTPDGRARFVAYHSKGLAEPPNADYPFILTNGRLYGHWHTQTRTGRIPKIQQLHPDPFLEIHPRDAKKLGIEEGSWVEVRSRRGVCRIAAKVTKAIAPGTVFMPMHWGALWAEAAEVNALTHPEACPHSLQPELKACAVQLVPLGVKVIEADQAHSASGSLS